MKKARIHLTIVLDEYRATAGMVTLDDLVSWAKSREGEFDTSEQGVRPEIEHLEVGTARSMDSWPSPALPTSLGFGQSPPQFTV